MFLIFCLYFFSWKKVLILDGHQSPTSKLDFLSAKIKNIPHVLKKKFFCKIDFAVLYIFGSPIEYECRIN